MDNVQFVPMTEEEERSQRELQNRINRRLDAEKRDRELHPEKERPILYDCSMGLSKILESISVASMYRDDRQQTFDVVLMNAWTFARNCFDKKLSRVDVIRNMQKDMALFIQYVQVYFTDQKALVEKPYICIYLPTYNIRDVYLRPETEEKRLIREYSEQYFKTVCTTTPKVSDLGSCYIYTARVGTNLLPHRDLQALMTKWDKGVTRPTQRRYLLISHIPLDFHLQLALQNKLYILESYTGKIKSIKDLGQKVFKEDYVSFNQYTHLLFGDRVMIKPLIARGLKKKVLEIAKKKRWDTRPQSLILSDIKHIPEIPVDVLLGMKF